MILHLVCKPVPKLLRSSWRAMRARTPAQRDDEDEGGKMTGPDPASSTSLVPLSLRLILPAATAMGVRLTHASREASGLGARLSNTRIICPRVGDNLGKLRIIPYSCPLLERLGGENSGALG